MIQLLLAFDLDGTLVRDNASLSEKMIEKLHAYYAKQYVLLFVTGRTRVWAEKLLAPLDCPFVLAPYNGATLISYPAKEVVRSAFLQVKDCGILQPWVDKFGVLVYSAEGDIFYTPSLFSTQMAAHIERRRSLQQESWKKIESLSQLEDTSIASIRFMLLPEQAEHVSSEIECSSMLRAPTMIDAFDDAYRVVQVTAFEASKGQALAAMLKEYPTYVTVGAGNDMNDMDLIRKADFGIAMADAPLALREMSYRICPVSEMALFDCIACIEKQIEEQEW